MRCDNWKFGNEKGIGKTARGRIRRNTYRLEAEKVFNGDPTPKDRISRIHALRGCELVEECPSIFLGFPGWCCIYVRSTLFVSVTFPLCFPLFILLFSFHIREVSKLEGLRLSSGKRSISAATYFLL